VRNVIPCDTLCARGPQERGDIFKSHRAHVLLGKGKKGNLGDGEARARREWDLSQYKIRQFVVEEVVHVLLHRRWTNTPAQGGKKKKAGNLFNRPNLVLRDGRRAGDQTPIRSVASCSASIKKGNRGNESIRQRVH